MKSKPITVIYGFRASPRICGWCKKEVKDCTCVAEMKAEYEYLERLHNKARKLNVPVTEVGNIKGRN